jgi:hypothetical protein
MLLIAAHVLPDVKGLHIAISHKTPVSTKRCETDQRSRSTASQRQLRPQPSAALDATAQEGLSAIC